MCTQKKIGFFFCVTVYMHTTIYTDHANSTHGFPRVPNLALIGEGMGAETVKVPSHIH